jgi:serine/threonine protein phosphatase PrpC
MTETRGWADGTRAAFGTDPGRVRTNNEDLPLVDRERGVYGVIDGVGGQAAGELAAAIAHDVILQRLSRPLGTPAERVRESIAIANNEIFRRASETPDFHGMTCVVTLAVVGDGTVTVGHVGDSRLYKLTPRGIRKLTRDHSPVGEREDAQEITEVEAMRHPRRHEVFRDVGGAERDKDEDDYVDVLQEPMENDSAILLCTDGLSDMLPSAAIERLVRLHAGNPERVVDALIAAANEAGGKDNITVVYVEGTEFAGAVTGQHAAPQSAHAVLRSRSAWFAAGALAGMLAALLLVWRVPATTAIGSRTIVVGSGGAGAVPRIADALRDARAGDTVRIEPGIYPERLVVPNGVNLIARVPSTVTIARAADGTGEWVAITAIGQMDAEISGIRIESTVELPIDVAIRLAGQRTIELVEVTGPVRTAIEVLTGATLTLHGSHFAVSGGVVATSELSHALVTKNVFLRGGRPQAPPIAIAPMAQATFRGNVFAGYAGEIVKGVSASERQQFAAANVIVNSDGR